MQQYGNKFALQQALEDWKTSTNKTEELVLLIKLTRRLHISGPTVLCHDNVPVLLVPYHNHSGSDVFRAITHPTIETIRVAQLGWRNQDPEQ